MKEEMAISYKKISLIFIFIALVVTAAYVVIRDDEGDGNWAQVHLIFSSISVSLHPYFFEM